MKKLLKATIIISGYVALVTLIIKHIKLIEHLTRELKKNTLYFKLLALWEKKKAKGNNLGEYLKGNGIGSVAIYGAGDMGRLLCMELELSGVVVRYFIDRNTIRDDEHKVINSDEEMEAVDAIIVTPFLDYDSIATVLREKTDSEILSLEDIVYDY